MLTKEDVLNRLREAVEQSGSQSAFADTHGISLQYVNDVLRGRRNPGAAILDALGIERKVSYQVKKK